MVQLVSTRRRVCVLFTCSKVRLGLRSKMRLVIVSKGDDTALCFIPHLALNKREPELKFHVFTDRKLYKPVPFCANRETRTSKKTHRDTHLTQSFRAFNCPSDLGGAGESEGAGTCVAAP